MDKHHLRIFISSPGDVAPERRQAFYVAEQLREEFERYFRIDAYLWESEPIGAAGHFQDYIEPPSAFDVVVQIVWSRLGTPLPDKTGTRTYATEDGRARTGTEWEYEEALAAHKSRGTPEIFSFRKQAPLTVDYANAAYKAARDAQWQALETFWARHFAAEGQFKAGFYTFTTAEAFAEKLSDVLRGHIKHRIAAQGLEARARGITWLKGNPYRGLMTYAPGDADIFYGRSAAAQAIVERLLTGGPLLLLGPSGAGKSSILRAGVFPNLKRLEAMNAAAQWRLAAARPSGHKGDLFDGLAQALTAPDALPELLAQGQSAGELAQVLRGGDARYLVGKELAQAAATAGQPVKLFLIADQLEEVFTDPAITAAQRETYLSGLAALARVKGVALAGAMRSDFTHRIVESAAFAALAPTERRYELAEPTPSEIAEMIEGPARAAGIGFEADGNSDERLNIVIAAAAAAKTNTAANGLPLLSYVMEQLFAADIEAKRGRELTFATYKALGELDGAIAAKADAVLAAQGDAARAALPRLFRALVQSRIGDAVPTARFAPLAQFALGTPERELAEAFLHPDARLLTAAGDDKAAHIRLAHEALLTAWTRASDWIRDNRRDLETRARLEDDAKLWADEEDPAKKAERLVNGLRLAEGLELLAQWKEDADNVAPFVLESEAARQREADAKAAKEKALQEAEFRRSRRLALIAGLAALVFAGVAVFAWLQYQEAETQSALAQSNLEKAMETANELLFNVSRRLDPNKAVVTPELKAELEAKIRALIAELSKGQTLSSGGERTRMASLIQEGETYLLRGDLENAKKNFETALEIGRQLAKSLGTPEALRDVSVSLNNVATIDQAQGNLKSARTGFAESLGIRRQLAKSLGTPEALRDVSVSLDNVARIDQAQGDLKSARTGFAESLGIRRQLAKSLGTPEAQEDVVVSLIRLSELALAEGKPGDVCPLMAEARPLAEANLKLLGTPRAKQVVDAVAEMATKAGC